VEFKYSAGSKEGSRNGWRAGSATCVDLGSIIRIAEGSAARIEDVVLFAVLLCRRLVVFMAGKQNWVQRSLDCYVAQERQYEANVDALQCQ